METITIRQIRNGVTGERIEVGPNQDGLSLIEIRHVHKTGDVANRIVLTQAEARLVRYALEQAVQEQG